jgi:7-alpha-hydroxysteroid dehydrogenase
MIQRELAGKVALITGGSRGLGASTARAFAAAGADVAIFARTISALNMVAEEIRVLGQHMVVIPADLADPDSASQVVAQDEQ